MSLGYEGQGALAKSEDGDEPICNTYYHHFKDGEDHPGGDVLLGLYNLPAGEYTLYSYHRHPGGLSPMPFIDVNCMYLGPGPKWFGDPNCTGVTQIRQGEPCDVNVGIPGDPLYDANLPYSMVKFITDVNAVLIRYRSQGKSGVLNAFILEMSGVQENAWKPRPRDNATGLCPEDVNLVWDPGVYVQDHNIYFGTSEDDVNESAAAYAEDVEPNEWTIPISLKVDTTYYWRVETVNDFNVNSPWPGNIWTFSTHDGRASDPLPDPDIRGLPPSAITELAWTASCFADSHKVYLGADLPGNIVLFDDDFESGAFLGGVGCK
jgi:hypothetical protein